LQNKTGDELKPVSSQLLNGASWSKKEGIILLHFCTRCFMEWNVLDWCAREGAQRGECAAADIRLVIQIYGLALCAQAFVILCVRASELFFSFFFAVD
jgi:hypothetical protein